jgi:predicted phosphodiesterase
MNYKNHKWLAVIFLVMALAANALAAQDQQIAQKLAALEKLPQKFSFVVLGDNRSGDDVYQKLLAMAMARKPDFILNTGDQIAAPGNLDDWNKFWEMSKTVTVPYFLTVGNHDANPKVPGSEKTYTEQVDLPGNELYYSFVADNSLFVVLDAYFDDEAKKITGEQFRWLTGLLAKAGQRHVFLFVHPPLYPEKKRGKHHGDSLDRYPEDRDRLQALFVKHKVTAVFTGHEHLYLRKTVGGVRHIITGGAGSPLYAGDEDGGFHHYIYMTVDGDKVGGEVVDVDGKVRDRF